MSAKAQYLTNFVAVTSIQVSLFRGINKLRKKERAYKKPSPDPLRLSMTGTNLLCTINEY